MQKCIFQCICHFDWFAAIDLKYFNVLILPRHRPDLRICIRKACKSVQSPPFWAVPVASCLHQGRGGCPRKRHLRSQLPRRLAHTGPVSSTVVRTQGHGAQSPQPVGASGQLEKSRLSPCAEDIFSRYGVGLGQPEQAAQFASYETA